MSQRVGTGLAGRALRPPGEHGAPDAAAQSGHNAAGAVLAQQGALLRVQSEFMRPAFDAVKEVDDFEQPGTERTAGLGPFKELSSHRCAPWGRVAVPTRTGCAGGRFLFRPEILRVCISVRLCSEAGQGGGLNHGDRDPHSKRARLLTRLAGSSGQAHARTGLTVKCKWICGRIKASRRRVGTNAKVSPFIFMLHYSAAELPDMRCIGAGSS